MKSIYKYEVPADESPLVLPAGAEILTIQAQRDIPCIWALVDTDVPPNEVRNVRIYGTGHRVPDSPGKYLGTFQLANGSLVFHAFEY